jgi:hypothetical protein
MQAASHPGLNVNYFTAEGIGAWLNDHRRDDRAVPSALKPPPS